MYYTSQRKAEADTRGGFELRDARVDLTWDLPASTKPPAPFTFMVCTTGQG